MGVAIWCFGRGANNMAAIWRLANSSRLSRLYSISRQLRQPYATTVDDDKPEPPNGFLFNEKVTGNPNRHVLTTVLFAVAIASWGEETERRMGEHLGIRNGIQLFIVPCCLSLQARHKVGPY